jgi:hypothetical protein
MCTPSAPPCILPPPSSLSSFLRPATNFQSTYSLCCVLLQLLSVPAPLVLAASLTSQHTHNNHKWQPHTMCTAIRWRGSTGQPVASQTCQGPPFLCGTFSVRGHPAMRTVQTGHQHPRRRRCLWQRQQWHRQVTSTRTLTNAPAVVTSHQHRASTLALQSTHTQTHTQMHSSTITYSTLTHTHTHARTHARTRAHTHTHTHTHTRTHTHAVRIHGRSFGSQQHGRSLFALRSCKRDNATRLGVGIHALRVQ